MNAAWLCGVEISSPGSSANPPPHPLCQRTIGVPTAYDLTYEDAAADDVVTQGRPGGLPVDTSTYPPPQYGEGIQATIRWLRGEADNPAYQQQRLQPLRK